MIQYFTINGESCIIYDCSLREGAVKSLLAWPALKKYEFNDWHEEGGIEADLSAPVLESREFDIPLYFATAEGYQTFYRMLISSAYHTISVPSLSLTKELRFVSMGIPVMVHGRVLVSARFADDKPLSGYVYHLDSQQRYTDGNWAIDEINLSRYGIRVLEGTKVEGWKLPSPKQNLTRNIATLPGVIYADYGAGEVGQPQLSEFTIKCYMSYPSAAEFIEAWDALLYDLTRPGARLVSGDAAYPELMCAYSRCSVGDVMVNGGISVIFGLTLTILAYERQDTGGGDIPIPEISGLITADGKEFITADGFKFITRDL